MKINIGKHAPISCNDEHGISHLTVRHPPEYRTLTRNNIKKLSICLSDRITDKNSSLTSVLMFKFELSEPTIFWALIWRPAQAPWVATRPTNVPQLNPAYTCNKTITRKF